MLPSIPYMRPATYEDVEVISKFLVRTIRYSFTKENVIGPQDYFKSRIFEEEYLQNMRKTINNPDNLSRVALKVRNLDRPLDADDILGYAGFGPRKPYLEKHPVTFEILCLFTEPTVKQQGLGTIMLNSLLDEAIANDQFQLGRDTIGVMTLTGNPSIRFYEKIGARKLEEVIFSYGTSPLPTTLMGFDHEGVRTLIERGQRRKHIAIQ